MALNPTKDDPDYWRNRAEEARAIAVQMVDAHTKATMLAIAQDYEKARQAGRATSWRLVPCRINRNGLLSAVCHGFFIGNPPANAFFSARKSRQAKRFCNGLRNRKAG